MFILTIVCCCKQSGLRLSARCSSTWHRCGSRSAWECIFRRPMPQVQNCTSRSMVRTRPRTDGGARVVGATAAPNSLRREGLCQPESLLRWLTCPIPAAPGPSTYSCYYHRTTSRPPHDRPHTGSRPPPGQCPVPVPETTASEFVVG